MTTKPFKAVGIVFVTIGLASLLYCWLKMHPSYEWSPYASGDLSFSYPSHWEVLHEATGDSSYMVKTHPKSEAEGHFSWDLTITDRGNTSPEGIISSIRERGTDSTPPRTIHLSNSIRAVTWDAVVPMVHFGIAIRWYVFTAPNGRAYTAEHYIPKNHLEAWRINRVFRGILGSMKFKDAPPAKQ